MDGGNVDLQLSDDPYDSKLLEVGSAPLLVGLNYLLRSLMYVIINWNIKILNKLTYQLSILNFLLRVCIK